MKSNVKKVFLSTFVVFILVIAYFSVKVVSSLPSPNRIAQSLKGLGKKILTEKDLGKKESTNAPATAKTESVIIDHTKNSIPTPEKRSEESIAKENEQIEKLLNEDSKDFNVCDKLGNPSFTDQIKGKDENLKIDDLFSEDRRSDPAIEAFRYPIRAIFQDEMVAPLLKEIIDLQKLNLSEDEKSGFLDKVGFYTRVGLASAHLYNKKEELEYLGNRVAHLVLINQIISKKPALKNDTSINEFCNSVQNSIKSDQQIDLREERNELQKLINYAGLTNKDLNFDPNEYIKFSVKSENGKVNFTLSNKNEEKK